MEYRRGGLGVGMVVEGWVSSEAMLKADKPTRKRGGK